MSFPNQLLECLMINVVELKNIQEDFEHYFGYSKKTQPPSGDNINMLAKTLFIHACSNMSRGYIFGVESG